MDAELKNLKIDRSKRRSAEPSRWAVRWIVIGIAVFLLLNALSMPGSFVLALAWMVLHPRPVWFLALSALLIGAGAWAAGRIAAGGPWRAA